MAFTVFIIITAIRMNAWALLQEEPGSFLVEQVVKGSCSVKEILLSFLPAWAINAVRHQLISFVWVHIPGETNMILTWVQRRNWKKQNQGF